MIIRVANDSFFLSINKQLQLYSMKYVFFLIRDGSLVSACVPFGFFKSLKFVTRFQQRVSQQPRHAYEARL